LNSELLGSEPFRQPVRDRWLALATGFVALVLYALTVQRTVSFWDCGEFISCAVILGVPHPPGTPLFVLLGRLFSLLPTAADVSLRVNLVSVVSGAGAVGITYLVAARILRRWLLLGFDVPARELLVGAASFGGAMLLGFASTVWSNAVEAEVYGLTLIIFMVIVYCTLWWIDVRYTSVGPRLLVFVSYMAVFGLGVALMVYLAIPGFWLIVLLFHEEYRRDWRVYVGALAMMLVMVTGTEAFLWNLFFLAGVTLFWLTAGSGARRSLSGWIAPLWAFVLYGLFQITLPLEMFHKYGWGTFDWVATIAIFVAATLGGFFARDEDASLSTRRWGLLGGIVTACIVAFSLQAFIPLRSMQNPRIDENNPETWENFKGFLERKQYGQISMVERMRTRRGLWQNQLGRHPRMGFWGFFEQQYALSGPAFIVLFVLGLLPFVAPFLRAGRGRAEDFPSRYGVALCLLITLVATTVGLVVYMNFSDGVFYDANASDQAYLEVRDRDYFFTTGFALFGVCIALGTAWLAAWAASRWPSLGRGTTGAAAVALGLLLPVGTVQANWFRNDRSANFIPYDYALNILNTCPQGTILFTNGDNDTFPVWCLQEAYGVRRDVVVVNLSLVNTDWYILQMKNQYGVPMHLTDEQILTVPTRLPDGRLYGKPTRPFADPFRGYTHDLVPYMGKDGELIRVQDQMVEQIVLANNWKAPVYFSGGYSGDTQIDLPHHMEMVALGYRLVKKSGTGMVDVAESRRLYDEVYAYRSFADATSYQDESAASLLWAYPEKMLQLSENYLDSADTTSALALAEKARSVLPAYWRTYQVLSMVYGAQGNSADSAAVVDSGLQALRQLTRVNPGNVLYLQSYALVLDVAGRPDEALGFLMEQFRKRPKEELLFVTLAQYSLRQNDRVRMELAARLWLDGHPNDGRARQLLGMATQMPQTAPAPSPRTP
jgi:hypothetical protein